MRKALAVGMMAVLVGCGGGGGGGGGGGDSRSVGPTVIIEPAVSSITSDVLIRYLEEQRVSIKGPDGQCSATAIARVCTGADFEDDVVKFTFLLRPADGQSANPVRITGYKITYDRCITGEVVLNFDPDMQFILTPNQPVQKDIFVVISEVKEDMVQQEQYTYTSPDGCPTTFTRLTYRGSCEATATLEFNVVDTITGRESKAKSQIKVRFENVKQEGECE